MKEKEAHNVLASADVSMVPPGRSEGSDSAPPGFTLVWALPWTVICERMASRPGWRLGFQWLRSARAFFPSQN